MKKREVKEDRAAKIKRWNKRILWVSGGAFAISLLIVGGLFVYYSFSSSTTRSTVAGLQQAYARRAAEVVRFVRIKQALVEAGQIITARTDYQAVLEGLYANLPAGVDVVDVEFVGTDVVTFTGKARGVADYERFIDTLEGRSRSGGFLFSEIVQSGLVRSRDGQYRFSLQLKFSLPAGGA